MLRGALAEIGTITGKKVEEKAGKLYAVKKMYLMVELISYARKYCFDIICCN